jgi:hypothetical protein
MKRLLFVALAMALVMGTAFSQETKPTLNIGGDLTWGFSANPDESQYDNVLDWAALQFSGNADEYNTYKFQMEYYEDYEPGPSDPITGAEFRRNAEVDNNAVKANEAYVTTNVAKYFGIDAFGVIFDWQNGYRDVDASIISAGTRFGFDEITDTQDLSVHNAWISSVTLGYVDAVQLKTVWAWDNGVGEDDIPDMLVEATTTALPGVQLAATYATGRTAGGVFAVSSKFAVADMVPDMAASGLSADLGASFAYNASATDDYIASGQAASSIMPEQAMWGASAKIGYLGADLGISYKGAVEDDENGAFGYAIVGFDAGYQITQDLGVYGGLAFDFTDYEAVDVSMENIDGLAGGEVGASLNIGASSFQSGYWFTDGYGAGQINALGNNADGGIFFRFTHRWGATI